ncbi:hypothetical protein L596_009704 [Steinernema carpocapsae]|uniref:F-BAR domain-containing protein n=1 Tax=Steinernema carpocapsae TaxID=34508 RepID=A0A4U5PG52_STECR|nr:hypothetical protein L596_009704 [Steinernema carpocapsae]
MDDVEHFLQRKAVIYEVAKKETLYLASLGALIHAFFQNPSQKRYNQIQTLVTGTQLWMLKVAGQSKQRQEDFEDLQQKRKENREEYKKIRQETIEAKELLSKAQMTRRTNDKCVELARKFKKLPSIPQLHEKIEDVEEEIRVMEEASQKMSQEIDGFNTRIAVGKAVVDQIGDYILEAISTRSMPQERRPSVKVKRIKSIRKGRRSGRWENSS